MYCSGVMEKNSVLRCFIHRNFHQILDFYGGWVRRCVGWPVVVLVVSVCGLLWSVGKLFGTVCGLVGSVGGWTGPWAGCVYLFLWGGGCQVFGLVDRSDGSVGGV
jgi:hypothetical protein